MKRLELSVASDADLFDILAYGTAVHGEAASDAYYTGLTDTFAFLCQTPKPDRSTMPVAWACAVGVTGSTAFSIESTRMRS